MAPPEMVRVRAVRPDRHACKIRFPKLAGYRVELPNDRLKAEFTPDHVLEPTPEPVEATEVTQVGSGTVRAVLNPYDPIGTTADVDFHTSKTLRHRTDPRRCHINWAILDSSWEGRLCQVVERHPKVLRYVKNHRLGFTVPYTQGPETRTYVPDFIVVIDDGRGLGRSAQPGSGNQGVPRRGCEGQEADHGEPVGAGGQQPGRIRALGLRRVPRRLQHGIGLGDRDSRTDSIT